jgi:hypothetical protein
MDVADEIRRWRQTRRIPASLPPPSTAPQRIAVEDHEVVVVRRRSLRLGIRARAARATAGQ